MSPQLQRRGTLEGTLPGLTGKLLETASHYAPGEIEADLYRWWSDAGLFGADRHPARHRYVIMMPPPASSSSTAKESAGVGTKEEVRATGISLPASTSATAMKRVSGIG